MNILGVGVLFSRGRGIDAFKGALIDGWRQPSRFPFRDRTIPAYTVDLEQVPDRAVLKKLRRSDKLSKMAVLAAADAAADSGLDEQDRKRMGVIVATAHGAHATTFEFLDGILDFGEAAVSPTVFSNSVHNAAASYISSALGIQGPTLTVTQFFFSFQTALQLAGAWLREGRVDHVLVGGVDQFGEVLGYVSGEKLRIADDGRIRPFEEPGTAVPGEGAAFFVVSGRAADRAYCRVDGIGFGCGPDETEDSGLDILDADGMIPDQSVYAPRPESRTPVACYAPIYGSMMTGSAFSVAAAALALKSRCFFSNPVLENPRKLNIVSSYSDSPVDFIRCIRYNCASQKSIIQLRKK